MDMGSGQMTYNKIPSEEEFARAEALEEERDKGLSEVRDKLLEQFKDKGVHEVFMFFSPDTETFGAYVFYLTDKLIDEAKKSGLASQIEEAVYEELENVGRGDRNSLKLDVEFDSHENVENNYDGDYYDRLR